MSIGKSLDEIPSSLAVSETMGTSLYNALANERYSMVDSVQFSKIVRVRPSLRKRLPSTVLASEVKLISAK